MTAPECGCCGKCIHPICPTESFQSPYDEVSREIGNNIMSIKVASDVGRIQEFSDNGTGVHVSCMDSDGKECKEGCVKVNLIPDKVVPAKQPEEEMFLLKSTRQYIKSDQMKNSLEIEFKAPRNYTPWPDPGPAPPIIKVIPKKRVTAGKKKKKGKK